MRAYARRVGQIDRMILSCFVLGISTRKIAHALMPVLGEPISASTVSRAATILDGAVEGGGFPQASFGQELSFSGL